MSVRLDGAVAVVAGLGRSGARTKAMSYDPQNYGAYGPGPRGGSAASRTSVPGILLLIVGVVNLLASFGLFVYMFFFLSVPVEELERQMENNPQQRKQLEDLKKEGYTIQQIKNMGATMLGVSGGLTLLAALLTLLGGICLYSHRGYALAVIGAILAAIPCLSPSGCCLLGNIVGVWAVVVLMNPDVKAAFRSRGLPPEDQGLPPP
jgi:hypothetical protein